MKKNLNMTIEHAERFFPDENFGLSQTQVYERISQGLTNKIKRDVTKSYLRILRKNVCTFFNLLCLICFVALIAVRAPITDFTFMVIYVANLALGIIQEIRAKVTLDKLSIVSTPTAKVLRNGEKIEISVDDLVLDDIMFLELGNQIPCDCVMLSGKVEVNESLLTGESVPVKKSVGDQLLGGSFVSGGNCVCRVDKVGDACYVQRLSFAAKKHKSPNSKLLGAMNAIIKTVGILIIPISGVMGLINYKALVAEFSGAILAREVVTKTATVILGMIPSGMFLLTTMALAVGVINLARNNTNVQDAYALEMLARVDVLCLDKTGTITDGQMQVTEVITLGELKHISINDAIYAMETALQDSNQTSNALHDYFKTGPTLATSAIVPFSSQRKLSAVTFTDYGTFVLGAPNYVFDKLDDKISANINKHSTLGHRVLILAHSLKPIKDETLPSDLKPICLIIIEDNIRKEAIETIQWFKDNDVKIKVISGDDPLTVSEISKRAGIENAEDYINLSGLNEEEILNIADKYTVFGRVSPEQKAILVKALKAHGHTVAMTGDGVNDILAMKEADCSVTVASGSSAAKSVAKLVLLDNNFNSMPKVVTEGRRVINNIQNSASLYLMKTMFTLTFAIISIIGGSVYPYTPGMMIMIEFCIIGLPSFVLSLQPNNKRVEGNFIIEVLSNALPGALILVLNVFIIQIVTNAIGMELPADIAESMSVVILTFGGWVFLVKLCTPPDLYKGFLVLGISVVLLVWVFFLMDTPLFNLASLRPSKDNWEYVLILVCIIQFDFPLLTLFKKILEKIKKATASQSIKN